MSGIPNFPRPSPVIRIFCSLLNPPPSSSPPAQHTPFPAHYLILSAIGSGQELRLYQLRAISNVSYLMVGDVMTMSGWERGGGRGGILSPLVPLTPPLNDQVSFSPYPRVTCCVANRPSDSCLVPVLMNRGWVEAAGCGRNRPLLLGLPRSCVT